MFPCSVSVMSNARYNQSAEGPTLEAALEHVARARPETEGVGHGGL